MPVTFISEDVQKTTLDSYNLDKKDYEQIPLVPRNLNSGWPLLQVSMFTAMPSNDHSLKYDHVLGGGKCHYFYIGAFNLAALITKIPGTIEVRGNRNKKLNKTQVKADNIELFLENFLVHHKTTGITISSSSGGYGKLLNIIIPEGDQNKLGEVLDDPYPHALISGNTLGASISPEWGESESEGMTEEVIQENINAELATFSNGQIFIDLGALLQKAPDQDIIDSFKVMFKVDEFCQLTALIPGIAASNPTMINAEQIDTALPINLQASNLHEIAVANQPQTNLQAVLNPQDIVADQLDPEPQNTLREFVLSPEIVVIVWDEETTLSANIAITSPDLDEPKASWLAFQDNLETAKEKSKELINPDCHSEVQLFDNLQSSLTEQSILFSHKRINSEQFRCASIAAIDTARPELEAHNSVWKQILDNLSRSIMAVIDFIINKVVHLGFFKPITESTEQQINEPVLDQYPSVKN